MWTRDKGWRRIDHIEPRDRGGEAILTNVMRYADDEHELITRIANWGNVGHSQFLDGTQDTDNLGIIQ